MALDIVLALLNDHTLPDALFLRARERWSEEQLVDLVSLIGYYAFLAMTINAFEITPE